MQRTVQQGKQSRLPEGVAAVHQLVAAALEAAFESHLPAGYPLLGRRYKGEEGGMSKRRKRQQEGTSSVSGAFSFSSAQSHRPRGAAWKLTFSGQPTLVSAQLLLKAPALS